MAAIPANCKGSVFAEVPFSRPPPSCYGPAVPDYVCIVQAGQAAESKIPELAEGLEQIGARAFGDEPGKVEIRWVSVPEGFGFSAGEPSSASLVIRSVPVGLGNSERKDFMKSITSLWERVTGCTADDIVVTSYDGPLPL